MGRSALLLKKRGVAALQGPVTSGSALTACCRCLCRCSLLCSLL